MAEIAVYLTLSGKSFDTNYVTKTLNICPTTIRLENEILRNGRFFGHTEWSYSTGIIDTNDVSVAFNNIVSKFCQISQEMKRIAEVCQAEWSFLVLIRRRDESAPTVIIPLKVIQLAAIIGAEIGFDLYM